MNYNEDYWFEKLIAEIDKSDVGAWEYLAQRGTPAGMPFETAYRLYVRLMKWDDVEPNTYEI